MRLAAILLAATFAAPVLAQEKGATPGAFDFYVLSLSWSPSYCAAEGADANPRQCAREHSFAFVVHGLWPQYERGYPEFCRTRQPDRVPRPIAERYLDIVPSVGLIGHQWRKHGSCSGLPQDEYFALLRKARERIAVPDGLASLDKPLQADPGEVEEQFISANPGITRSSIAVTCDGRYLREVRICMDRDLEFRPCPQVDGKSCSREEVLMPPAR